MIGRILSYHPPTPDGLTKALGRQILFSGDFAELCRGKGEALGTFPLKGIGAEQPVYALTTAGAS